ncbi:MAG: IclR family transcriptional regulator [Bifidobacterium sp.]
MRTLRGTGRHLGSGTDMTADRGDSDNVANLAPAAARAMRILDVLAESRGTALSLTEIADRIGAAKSSTSNICVILEAARMIRRDSRGFVLGLRTVELGGAYLSSFDEIREFYRLCTESEVLRHRLVQLATLEGHDVLYLARYEGATPLVLTAAVGDRFPASATALGGALLMVLTPEQIAMRYEGEQNLPILTEHSTPTVKDLQAKVQSARDRGYSIDYGEVFSTVFGIAVPIRPQLRDGQPMAVGVSIIERRRDSIPDQATIDETVAALQDMAHALGNPMSCNAMK